jgi:hypothetical protein
MNLQNQPWHRRIMLTAILFGLAGIALANRTLKRIKGIK